ncbi:hypothetical protein [Tenacibaculum aiptasiae]|uniref:hypothetical protein n=1 Tax=Tenacibaculum aiptasiae TaxID=426481 RepID=UPI002330579F|nr:hypothetical protein [Tenacibaculum aiptasiae]
MIDYQQFQDYLGIKIGYLISGGISGIIGLLAAQTDDKKGFGSSLLRFFVGMFTTVYLTPMVVDKFNFSESSAYGISFIIGLTSMNLVRVLLKLSSDIEFLKRLIPTKS